MVKNVLASKKETIEAHLREPNCPFVLFVGAKKMVKRKEFEEYISKTSIF